MGVSINKLINSLPRQRRVKIESHATELISKEYTIRELRKARKITQKKLAEILDIGQDSISRLEKRRDLRLSTLQEYINALGGGLRLIAQFPGNSAVELIGFGNTKRNAR